MSARDDGPTAPHERPDGRAWREAQRAVDGKNDATQQRGRAERAERERAQAARRRLADERGNVYR
jgi:hypothetical protein